MDITAHLIKIVVNYWYLLPIALFAGLFKTAWFKGVFGEFQVNLLIRIHLSGDDYHLIKNITLPTEDGTTQIDHVLVSKFGIFVIETKNMKGWIFGSAHQKEWTQKIYKHSSKFQNPIHQNYKHLKTLERCLGIPVENLFSVIVFIGDSTFKTDMPDNVTYASGCIKYIKSKTARVLTDKLVNRSIALIEEGRLKASFKTDQNHTAHVKQIVERKITEGTTTKKATNKAKTCPKCKAEMVMREAKRGTNKGDKFWGCSSFPKCRTVIKAA